MKMAGNLAKAALAALLAAAAAVGCTPAGSDDVGPGVLPGPDSNPPGGVLLRHKLVKDQRLRYDCRLKLNSDGETWTSEDLHAVLNITCLGSLSNPGGSGGLFKINIVREEVEREKQTKDADSRKQPPIRLVRNVEPDISTAYGYDADQNMNFFPCDERGSFGLTATAKFHRVTYDSLVYLLPVLPAEKVAVGSVWTAEMPVYAGTDYVYGQAGYRGGSDFPLKITGRVEKVYARGGSQLARLSWRAIGSFDSQGYADRFPPGFHARQRLIHEVEATGEATFDVTRGLVLAKDGRATITFTSLVKMVRDREEPRWEKNVTRHRLSYECKLMP